MRRPPSTRQPPPRIPIEKAPCESSRGFLAFRSGGGMLAHVPEKWEPVFRSGHAQDQGGAANAGSFVGQADAGAAAEPGTVLVGLEPDGADAVGGELLVAILGIAGDADRAD